MPPSPGQVMTVPPSGTVAIWAAGPGNVAQTILTPVGFAPADIAFRTAAAYLVATVEVDQEARAVYLGRVETSYNKADVRLYVVLAAVGLSLGEVAICTGTPGIGGSQALTRVGWSDASAVFVGAGAATITVTMTGVVAGDHLWLAWYQKHDGQQGSNLATFDPATADHLTSCVAQFKAATRLSTMASPTTFGIMANNTEPLWSVVGLRNV